MSIGIIGNGGHSKRIQKILIKKKYKFQIYKPKKPKYFDAADFKRLKDCDIIFIVSPNNTHYKYLKSLYKDRYIFCEKPPVNNRRQLSDLKTLNTKKIYFNYNFRFFKIAEILQKRESYKMGKLIYANLLASQGLAKKKQYKTNWRSNFKKCPKGIYEIVSIHYIDLINYLFEIFKIEKPTLINSNMVGNSYDTSHVKIRLKNKGLLNIFSTYNSAYSKNLFFLFENGIIEQRDNMIIIRGPSLNLDKNGFFKQPKLIKKININENRDQSNSLLKSVSFFLDTAKKKKFFNKKIWDCSLESNSLIL